MLNHLLELIVKKNSGVEIGGPSGTGHTIYEHCKNLDNVIFSNQTIWHHSSDEFHFYPGKSGKTIINDAVDISQVENELYDFCFSSHCLEHIANPIKALKEWLRIIKKDGYIIIIVPEKSVCFDHRREITTFSTLLSQYEKNVGEDNLYSLSEILEKHDLSMDPGAGDFENFRNRSLDNFNNRCLHHFIYSQELLKEICSYLNCEFIYSVTQDINIWFIMKKK